MVVVLDVYVRRQDADARAIIVTKLFLGIGECTNGAIV